MVAKPRSHLLTDDAPSGKKLVEHTRPRTSGRGRDDHRWPPPAQIRTCAFTHTALTEDEWRRSAYQDKDAEHGVVESTDPAAG